MAYYEAKPGMTVKDFVSRWQAGDKAYDYSMPVMMDIEDLWKYRDYTRNRKFVKSGFSWPYDSDEGKLERSSKQLLSGEAKWDAMLLSMDKYGWNKQEPLYLYVGQDGKAKVGEGNHRLAIWREMGKKEVPVIVIFSRAVFDTYPGMSRPPQVVENMNFKVWLSGN